MGTRSTYTVDSSQPGHWTFRVKPADASIVFVVVSLLGFCVLAVILGLGLGFATKSGGGALAGVGAAFAYFWWQDWGSFFSAARHRKRAQIEVSSDGLVAGRHKFSLGDIAAIDVRAPAKPAQSPRVIMSQQQVTFVGEARAVMLTSAAQSLQNASMSGYAAGHQLGAAIGDSARRTQADRSYAVAVCAAHQPGPIVIAGGLRVECAESLVRDLTRAVQSASGRSAEENVDAHSGPARPFDAVSGGFDGGLVGKLESQVLSPGFLVFGVFGFVAKPLWQFLSDPRARGAKLAGVALCALALVFFGMGKKRSVAHDAQIPEATAEVQSETAFPAARPEPPPRAPAFTPPPAQVRTRTPPPAPRGAPASASSPNAITSANAAPAAAPPVAPSPAAPPPTTYAVVDVQPGDTLNVRASAHPSAPKLFELAPTAQGLLATGRESGPRGATWIEINAPQGTGWINRAYVTEEPREPCTGPAIGTLVTRFTQALHAQNGGALFRVVSPARGLVMRRDVGASSERIAWQSIGQLFSASAPKEWTSLLPSLKGSLDAAPAISCGRVVVPTGSSLSTSWPTELAAFLPVTLTPTGALSTWVLGVEYFQGKPYVAALVEYPAVGGPGAL